MPKPRFFDSFRTAVTSLRERENMSQSELAERIGLSRTSITNIEAGRQGITEETLMKVAKALGYRVQLRFSKD